jgi:hypothetical protein
MPLKRLAFGGVTPEKSVVSTRIGKERLITAIPGPEGFFKRVFTVRPAGWVMLKV